MFIICENGNALSLDKVARMAATDDGLVLGYAEGYVETVAELPNRDLAQRFIITVLNEGPELCGNSEPGNLIFAGFVKNFILDTTE